MIAANQREKPMEPTEGSEPTTTNETPRRGRRLKGMTGVFLAFAMLSAAGIAGAMAGFQVRGAGQSDAVLKCGGGMTRLGHVFDEDASIFPGDPSPEISIDFTIEEDFFLLETVKTGTHTGTHFDAPGHFVEGGRTVDELEANEFVWPAYVIDVRDRMASEGPDFQLTKADIRRYERENGRIKRRSLVIIYTGFDELFGTPDYLDEAPGFSGDAVQWMFDRRGISGLGSDTFGPDASSDGDFSATFTALDNDGVAIPGLNNLDSLNTRGDIIIASVVALRDGSGYQTDPLACHRS